MGRFVQLLVFGVPVLLALVAYLLPGVRVLRSIAGALCILIAAVMAFLAVEAGSDESLQIMAMVVVLAALAIALRPERKPKPAAPFGQPAPAHPQPFPQQPQQAPLRPQPQQPPQPQPSPPQAPPQHAPTQPPPPGYPTSG